MSKKKSRSQRKNNNNTSANNNNPKVKSNNSKTNNNNSKVKNNNSTVNTKPKVKEMEEEQSNLKSVMNTMEKVRTGNSNEKEKLMDFSKIDDEYEGELRRQLTPKERFFRVCEKFGDLFLLNVFFTLTSLPVVTMGASFTAMYTVTLKMVRNEDVPIKDGYFKAFKRNFKQSTQIWVGLLVVFYIVYRQLKLVLSTSAKSANFMVSLLGIQLILLTFLLPLLFPMIARYENTNLNMLKNSMLAALLHLGTWATVFFLWMIPVFVYYFKPTLFYYTWYLWLVFLSAFVAYTCSYRLRNMFDKIEEDPIKKMIEEGKAAEAEAGKGR